MEYNKDNYSFSNSPHNGTLLLIGIIIPLLTVHMMGLYYNDSFINGSHDGTLLFIWIRGRHYILIGSLKYGIDTEHELYDPPFKPYRILHPHFGLYRILYPPHAYMYLHAYLIMFILYPLGALSLNISYLVMVC